MSTSKNLADIVGGLRESPTDRLMREMADSPVQKAMRDLMDSSTHRALRDLYDSPAAAKMAREISDSSAAKAARDLYDTPTMRAVRELQDSPVLRSAREMQTGLLGDPSWLETRRQLEDARTRFDELALGSVGRDATYRKLAAAGAITGRLADHFSDIAKNHSLLDSGVLASLNGSLAEATRANQWASHLAGVRGTDFAAFIGSRSPITEEIERVQLAASNMLSGSTEIERLRLSATLGLDTSIAAEMAATRSKLSALAGAGDVLGFEARTSFTAYEQVFGDWHTRPDLPRRFWRDPAMRRRRYREAEVDPGLIETTPAVAVEVVIESGFATGFSEAGTSVALLDIAGLSMQIRSSNFGVDAFRAIGAFEQALRLLIATKLEELAGPQWFKQRVDGDTRKKARDNRAAAMANGEKDKVLIAYLDLGDLIAVLLRKDNWDGVFGHVFPNRQRLEFDLQALVASRRPTMHARNVDAVRLVELICIIRRLTQWIEDDGEWKQIAASED